MGNLLKKVAASFTAAAMAVALVPAIAWAEGPDPIVIPDGTGVTNPAASIELVDPVADRNFYLYEYNGDENLVFPEDDYPYYKETHTVKVRLIGEDPSKDCDDKVAFFSSQTCDVITLGQEDLGGGLRSVTVGRAGHGGPGQYTVAASSGLIVKNIFKAVNQIIPASVELDKATVNIGIGGVTRVSASNSEAVLSSSDESVATVSSAGIVTGVGNGTADIVATYAKYGLKLTAVCKVTVGAQAEPAKVSKPAKAKLSSKTKSSKKGKLTIAWKSVRGAKSYQVAYKVKGAKSFTTKTVGASKLSKTVSAKKGKKYVVKVRAKNSAGYGAYSSTKTVKVKK